MNTFRLFPKERILLYGGGKLGRFYYAKFCKIFSVVGFLDKNAMSMRQINGIPVYLPSDFIRNKSDSDIPVFVSYHNAVIHQEIANSLYNLGFRKIIFLPAHFSGNELAENEMRKAYNLMIEEDYYRLKNIPLYCEFLENTKKIEKVLRRTDRFVIFEVSFELLYTGCSKALIGKDAENKDLLSLCDLPVIANKPYRELFNYFINGNGNPDYYLNIYTGIQGERFNRCDFLNNRFDVYKSLELNCLKKKDIWAPLDVNWNDRGYFNIIDGHHRAIYLFLKNIKKVPIRVTIDDYKKYCNKEKAKEIKEYLENNGIDMVCTPIPYFELFCIPSKREIAGKTVLGCIQAFWYEKACARGKIIDLSVYNSYFARNCYRMKTNDVTSVEVNLKDFELAKLLNELLHIQDMNLIYSPNRFEIKGQYDIAFLMGSFELKRCNEIVDFLNKHIKKMVIWESQADPKTEKEEILKKTKFTKYIYLDSFYTGAYCSEVGVFCVGGNNE